MIVRGLLLLLLLMLGAGTWPRHVLAFSVSRDVSLPAATLTTASLTEVIVTTKLTGTSELDTNTHSYLTSPVLPDTGATENKTIEKRNSTETVSPVTKESNEIVTEASSQAVTSPSSESDSNVVSLSQVVTSPSSESDSNVVSLSQVVTSPSSESDSNVVSLSQVVTSPSSESSSNVVSISQVVTSPSSESDSNVVSLSQVVTSPSSESSSNVVSISQVVTSPSSESDSNVVSLSQVVTSPSSESSSNVVSISQVVTSPSSESSSNVVSISQVVTSPSSESDSNVVSLSQVVTSPSSESSSNVVSISQVVTSPSSESSSNVVSSIKSKVLEYSAAPVRKLYTTIYRNKSTDTKVLADPITTSTSLDDVKVQYTTTSTSTTTTTTTESPSPPTEQITSTSNDTAEVTDKLQVSETRNDLMKYETTKTETAIKPDTTTNKEVATEYNSQQLNAQLKLESAVSSTTTELPTTTQQRAGSSDKSTVTQPTTTDGKKTSTLYVVKSAYKRPKKLEIVQPKPYLRDPNDNSWRNESISSLGIVFRPNDATNKTLALVKNRTEVELPAAIPEVSPEPELKQRLDKLSSARRAGKRPPTSPVQQEDENDTPIYYYDSEVEEVTPKEDAIMPGAGAELRAAEFFREFEALLDAGTTPRPPPAAPPTPRPSTTQYFPPSSVKHFRELIEEVRPEPFVPSFGQDPRGALYAALIRRLPPCEVRCGEGAGVTSGAVELSPDYELHYYIPEQEEQAAAPPHSAHPALALYTPRALSRDGL